MKRAHFRNSGQTGLLKNPFKPECCPDNEKRGRSVAHPEESPVVIAFRKKMASEEARKQYRRRGRIVEFCHAWIKSTGLEESADGNAVGLPHLQPAALDPIEQAPHNNSDHLR